MKTLILPVEIFRREMDGRLLHAIVALQAGWDVILGANLEINRNIWRLPRGVYLFSTLSHKRLLMSRMLKDMGFASQGWDEEGLIYLNRDLYLARRVSSQTLANIDQIFAWGDVSRADLDIKAAAAGKEVKAIGNPRLDLLRKRFHPIYAEDMRRIRENHGDFVLFNANFPSVNFIQKNKDLRQKTMEGDNTALAASLYEKFLAHRKFMLSAFVEIIPQIARRLAPRRLVVRPHPAENAQTWRTALRDCPNATVVTEGPIIPWLLAARALLHNDCTTAVEARLLGCEPVAYIPPAMPKDGATMLPNAVSHHAATLDEVHDVLLAALHGTLQITEAQKAALHAHVSGMHGPLAAELAVASAEELIKNHAPSPWIRRFSSRVLGITRHAWKEISPQGRRSRQYIAKVFPDQPEDYIMNRLHALGGILGVDPATIRLQRLGRNIYLLRRFS